MSEQMEMKSLVTQATQLGSTSRSDSSGKEVKNTNGKPARRGGFDGMLKTFLGNEQRSAGGGASGAAGQNAHKGGANKGAFSSGKSARTGRNGASASTAGMAPKNREALRKSLDKTVPAEEVPGEAVAGEAEAQVTPEVAAAAQEAALIIWNLLYPAPAEAAPLDHFPGFEALDALGALAGMLHNDAGASGSALSGLGASEVDAEMMRDALATANASAEMNIEAVLSSLDELLDGMPREVLEEALVQAADDLGLDAEDPLRELLDALNVEVVEVVDAAAIEADAERLLASLAPGQEAVPVERAAESPPATLPDAPEASEEIVMQEDGAIQDNVVAREEAATRAEPVIQKATVPQAIHENEATIQEAAVLPDEAVVREATVLLDEAVVREDAVHPKEAVAQEETRIHEEAVAEVDAVVLEAAVFTERVVVEEKSHAAEQPVEETLPSETVVASPEAQRQKVAETAENSDLEQAEIEIFGRIKQFLEEFAAEKSPERPITLVDSPLPALTDEVITQFVGWLSGQDNSEQAKELLNDKAMLREVLASLSRRGDDATPASASGQTDTIFSWSKKLLESLLHSSTEKNAPGNAGEASGNGFAQLLGGRTGMETGPQTLFAARPEQNAQTGNNSASSVLDQIQNIERLADAMRMANRGQVKSLTLQLSPPELGKVMLRVETRDGIVSAFLRVEKAEAANQLAGGLQHLRENLKAQGIELGELDIRQQQQQNHMAGYGENQNRRNREADPDAERHSRHGRERGRNEDAGIAEAAAPSPTTAGPGYLNLFA